MTYEEFEALPAECRLKLYELHRYFSWPWFSQLKSHGQPGTLGRYISSELVYLNVYMNGAVW
jgi:hypothetical protein